MASPARRALRALEELDLWLAQSVENDHSGPSSPSLSRSAQSARNVTFSLPEDKIQEQTRRNVTHDEEHPSTWTSPVSSPPRHISASDSVRRESGSSIGSQWTINSPAGSSTTKHMVPKSIISDSPVSPQNQSSLFNRESQEPSPSIHEPTAASASDPALPSASRSDTDHLQQQHLHYTDPERTDLPRTLTVDLISTTSLLTPSSPVSVNGDFHDDYHGFLSGSQSLQTSMNLPLSLSDDSFPMTKASPPAGEATSLPGTSPRRTPPLPFRPSLPAQPPKPPSANTRITTNPPPTQTSPIRPPPVTPTSSQHLEPMFHQSSATFTTTQEDTLSSPSTHSSTPPAPTTSRLAPDEASVLSPGHLPSQALVEGLLQARQGRPEMLYREAERLYRERLNLDEDVTTLRRVLQQVKEEYRRRIETIQAVLKETEARADSAEVTNRVLETRIRELSDQLTNLQMDAAYSSPRRKETTSAGHAFSVTNSRPSDGITHTGTSLSNAVSHTMQSTPSPRKARKSPTESIVSHLQLSELERQLHELRSLVATQARILVAYDAAQTSGFGMGMPPPPVSTHPTPGTVPEVSSEALHETLAQTEELMAKQGWNKKYLHFSNAVLSPPRRKAASSFDAATDPDPLLQSPAMRNSRFLRDFEREISAITQTRPQEMQKLVQNVEEEQVDANDPEEIANARVDANTSAHGELEHTLHSPLRHLRQGQERYRARHRRADSEENQEKERKERKERKYEEEEAGYSAIHAKVQSNRSSGARDLIQRRLGLRNTSPSGEPPASASTSTSPGTSHGHAEVGEIAPNVASHTFRRSSHTRIPTHTRVRSARPTKGYLRDTFSSRASRQPPAESNTAHEPPVQFSRTLRSGGRPSRTNARRRMAQSLGPQPRAPNASSAGKANTSVEMGEPTRIPHPPRTGDPTQAPKPRDYSGSRNDSATDDGTVSIDSVPQLPKTAQPKLAASGPILSTLDKILANKNSTNNAPVASTPVTNIPLNSYFSQNSYSTPAAVSQATRDLTKSSLAKRFGLCKDSWDT